MGDSGRTVAHYHLKNTVSPLGIAIRNARLAQNMYQVELAQKMGIKYSAVISRWELGHAVPSLAMAAPLSKILGDKNILQLVINANSKNQGSLFKSSTKVATPSPRRATPSVVYRTIFIPKVGGMSMAVAYNPKSNKTNIAMTAISPSEVLVDSEYGHAEALKRLRRKKISAIMKGDRTADFLADVLIGVAKGSIRPNVAPYRPISKSHKKAIRGPIWWKGFQDAIMNTPLNSTPPTIRDLMLPPAIRKSGIRIV